MHTELDVTHFETVVRRNVSELPAVLEKVSAWRCTHFKHQATNSDVALCWCSTAGAVQRPRSQVRRSYPEKPINIVLSQLR